MPYIKGGNAKAFLGQARDIISPACPGSSPGPPPGETFPYLTQEAPRSNNTIYSFHKLHTFKMLSLNLDIWTYTQTCTSVMIGHSFADERLDFSSSQRT